ncbi:SPOR domain-containing protein [Flavobacteriaceae bacterium R38]|nr:SPOR domain-containing protein [Flavobacteriaceae bacterium R38]
MRFLALKKNIFIASATLFVSNFALGQDSTNIEIETVKKEGVVTIDQDSRIERLFQLKRSLKKTYYTIQIYSEPGNSGGFPGSREAKTKFETEFYGWPSEISFEIPNYKVRVGKFATRLEADKSLMEIKKKYPNAFIITP